MKKRGMRWRRPDATAVATLRADVLKEDGDTPQQLRGVGSNPLTSILPVRQPPRLLLPLTGLVQDKALWQSDPGGQSQQQAVDARYLTISQRIKHKHLPLPCLYPYRLPTLSHTTASSPPCFALYPAPPARRRARRERSIRACATTVLVLHSKILSAHSIPTDHNVPSLPTAVQNRDPDPIPSAHTHAHPTAGRLSDQQKWAPLRAPCFHIDVAGWTSRSCPVASDGAAASRSNSARAC